MAVRRVLAQADVREQHELGIPRPQLSKRSLHDSLFSPRARALLVLRVRDAEQDHRGDAEAHELLDLARQAGNREATQRRQLPVRARVRPDEERLDEVVEVEPRLAHERAKRAGTAQPAEASVRESAHAANLRISARATATSTSPIASSHAASIDAVRQGSTS